MAPTAVSDPSDVPLAVWPCAQTTAQYQRAGRYTPESTRHPGKMLPELAHRIVTCYSAPGDLVADPMCGIGTTLVEASALDRRSVGVELEQRWAAIAAANLDRVLTPGQRALAEVRVGDALEASQVLADVAATVDLVVTSPPYGCAAEMIDRPAWEAGGRLCPADTLNYTPQRANLGHAYQAGMAQVYAECFALLRPGGLLVTVTKNMRRHGRLADLAVGTRQLCEQAGFGYLQHVVALHAGVRDGQLAVRPSLGQLMQVRRARANGDPVHLVAHEDVLVFAKPAEAAHG